MSKPDDLHMLRPETKKSLRRASDILEVYFDQKLVWHKNRSREIKWRVISRDDPFWGKTEEWLGWDLDNAG